MANYDPLRGYDDFGGSRGNGYDYDAGMSVNAVYAYEDGRKPLSKFTAQDFKDAGWKETKRLALALAESGFWTTDEWHHSGGGYYNKVSFYDPQILVRRWDNLTNEQRAEHRENNKPTPKTPVEDIKVAGRYAVWTRDYKGRRKVSHHESFEGVKRGDWIFLPNGKKKKARGLNINWEIVL